MKTKLNQKELQALRVAIRQDSSCTPEVVSYICSRSSLAVAAWGAFTKKQDFEYNDESNNVHIRVDFSNRFIGSAGSGHVKKAADLSGNSNVTQEPANLGPKGRGKGKKPAKQVTSVALDDDLIQALNQRAEREERTVSALIRLAIKHYLECVK